MMDTAVAKMLRNLGHIMITLTDEFLGFCDFEGDPVINRTGAGRFFEDSAQISAADGKVGTEKRKRRGFGHVGFNEVFYGIH